MMSVTLCDGSGDEMLLQLVEPDGDGWRVELRLVNSSAFHLTEQDASDLAAILYMLAEQLPEQE